MTFADHVDAWSNFFMLAGTAAATLIGLLFVAISLRADIRTQDETSYVRTTARHSFQSYLSVLLFAFYFLIPDPSPDTIAWPVIITSAITLMTVVRSGVRLREQALTERHTFLWQFVVPAACYVAAMAVGIGLFWQEENGIYWFVSVIAFLLVIPTRNAWYMLLSHTGDA